MTDKRLDFDEEGFVEQIMKDCQPNPDDIDAVFIEQAGLYAYYSVQAANAAKKRDRLKLKRDAVKGKRNMGIRTEQIENGVKVTESMVESLLAQDREYIAAQLAYMEASSTADMIRDCLEALKQRKDSFVQLGVQRREEMKGTPRVVDDRIRDLEDRGARALAGR